MCSHPLRDENQGGGCLEEGKSLQGTREDALRCSCLDEQQNKGPVEPKP
jgi:hypothetical protein